MSYDHPNATSTDNFLKPSQQDQQQLVQRQPPATKSIENGVNMSGNHHGSLESNEHVNAINSVVLMKESKGLERKANSKITNDNAMNIKWEQTMRAWSAKLAEDHAQLMKTRMVNFERIITSKSYE